MKKVKILKSTIEAIINQIMISEYKDVKVLFLNSF